MYAAPARADVWGYVDSKGVAHFSVDKLDERYELFSRSNETFAAGGTDAPRALEGERPSVDTSISISISISTSTSTSTSSSTAVQLKLLAFFDISPSYKAVKHLLRDASVLHGIDFELLQALIATESGFDTYAVSPKGAVGLMQLIPPTAERYGVRADKTSPVAKKLTDPKTNIRAGSSYLKDLINMFPGQLELAVAAYNAGEGAVQRAGNKVPNYPETKNYVKTVMQLYGRLKPPESITESRRVLARVPGRVRMEMMGGAVGRNNMTPLLGAQTSDSSTSAEIKRE